MGAASLNAKAKALIEALRAAEQRQPDKVPDGFLTAAQIMAAMGCSKKHVCRLLKDVKPEMRTFKIRNSKGRLSRIPHYSLTQSWFDIDAK